MVWINSIISHTMMGEVIVSFLAPYGVFSTIDTDTALLESWIVNVYHMQTHHN